MTKRQPLPEDDSEKRFIPIDNPDDQVLHDEWPEGPMRLTVRPGSKPVIEWNPYGKGYLEHVHGGVRPWMGWLLSLAADGVKLRYMKREAARGIANAVVGARPEKVPLSPLSATSPEPSAKAEAPAPDRPPSTESASLPSDPPASSGAAAKPRSPSGSQKRATPKAGAGSKSRKPPSRTRSK